MMKNSQRMFCSLIDIITIDNAVSKRETFQRFLNVGIALQMLAQ